MKMIFRISELLHEDMTDKLAAANTSGKRTSSFFSGKNVRKHTNYSKAQHVKSFLYSSSVSSLYVSHKIVMRRHKRWRGNCVNTATRTT